jgi:hypothetical protein
MLLYTLQCVRQLKELLRLRILVLVFGIRLEDAGNLEWVETRRRRRSTCGAEYRGECTMGISLNCTYDLHTSLKV